MVEKNPPPPFPLENFDEVVAPALPDGWTTTGGNGTAWQLGDPTGGPATGPPSAKSVPNCVGTNIDAMYTDSAEVSLISPIVAISSSGAILRYRQFIDTDDPPGMDAGSVSVLDADNADAVIEEIASGITGLGGDWTSEVIPLPAAAHGKNIKIAFCFTSDDNNVQFSGFYVDDVEVTAD